MHAKNLINTMQDPSVRTLHSELTWKVPAPSVGNGARHAAFLLMAAYIWFLPLRHTIAVRNLAFFPLVILTLWAGSRREGLRLRIPFLWAWAVYGVVALASLTYAIHPLYSIGQIKEQIGYALLVLLIFTSWVNGPSEFSKLMRIIVAGVTLMIGYSLLNSFVLSPFWHSDFRLHQGSLADGFGTFSTYLITTLPLVVTSMWVLPRTARLKRAALALLITGGLVALYLTGNREGALALGGELVVAAALVCATKPGVCRNRKVIALGAITGIFCVAFFARLLEVREPLATDPRTTLIWPLALHNITAEPFTGGGFGIQAFKMRNPAFCHAYSTFSHAHNMILNKGVQMGIPGVLAFLVLWFGAIRAIWPDRNLAKMNSPVWAYLVAGVAMSAGVFLKNMTDDFFVNDGAFLYWLLIGALIGMRSAPHDEWTP
ncbi:MAG: hypothetical protein M0037_04305 [Betaproteobacteria bacterium]|nr:hypothetical protein [Betaproteobacteria bacterium]